MFIAYTRSVPASTTVAAELVTLRSALPGPTLNVAVPELLRIVTSAESVETDAVLPIVVTTAPDGTLATIVKVAVAPAGRLVCEQPIVPLAPTAGATQVQPAGAAIDT